MRASTSTLLEVCSYGGRNSQVANVGKGPPAPAAGGPSTASQLCCQRGQRQTWAGSSASGSDAQRPRQSRAQRDQLVPRFSLSFDSFGTQSPGEQLTGLGLGKHVQGKQARTFGCAQADQLAATGHQHNVA